MYLIKLFYEKIIHHDIISELLKGTAESFRRSFGDGIQRMQVQDQSV